MNKSLLFLSAAASLAVVSCNQDKQAAVDAAVTPSADTAVVMNDNMDYRADADRTVTQIADDLDLDDTSTVSTIGRGYYDRGRRFAEVNNQYKTDTTGFYAAQRSVNDETDNTVKGVVTEDQYNTYTSNRGTYYAGTPYTPAPAPVAKAAPAKPAGPTIVKREKRLGGDTKITYSNGKVIKIDKDGDTKVKYSDGTKVKTDADDGNVKIKD
ncbi:T-complex 10 C-terminal domain-containing protein [Hymenobacter aerophilus]|uniref:T-complex 10 C-terminal domain-containing protein n=1 Tax=Hymenobacter aerophilus TaxID=119644 RepID=UPI00036F47C3|nr:T-complex 10 C-terminal domain-containing protein [Hymenobacter aerophilus]